MNPTALVFCLLLVAAAQPPVTPFKLTAEDLQDAAAELEDTEWAYRFRDDPAWAARDYDDSAWAVSGFVAAAAHPEQSPPDERWDGRAWFRLRLDVDDKLAGRPLALRMQHWGASEVYSVSVYLARNFARTNSTLEAQLSQVQELSARALEHERTEADLIGCGTSRNAPRTSAARELEEAKQLQLSMLPKTLPRLRRLEIAAYMKTSTEVGGDYYDFHAGADDTLTVAIGDATGHGLKAGTVVTATQSLFNAFAPSPPSRSS